MNWQQIKVTNDATGCNLLTWLRSIGAPIVSECGGHGACGKCEVKVLSGAFSTPSGTATGGAVILACQAKLLGDEGEIAILHPRETASTLTSNDTASVNAQNIDLSIALDIGTTTLEASAIDAATDKRCAKATLLNPQATFGADVISRISAADNGDLQNLTAIVRSAAKELIDRLLEELKYDHSPSKIIIVGNPAMTHIFCGISPSTLGKYPFTPVFTDARKESGEILGYNSTEIILPPLASAFIGSDITTGAVCLKLCASPHPALMVDLGTNGEIVLWTGKKLLTTTAAAGPALEGATISCGIGGVKGAIYKLDYNSNGEVIYKTIGDAKPVGVCGSGLVEIIAHLMKTKEIDETGLLLNGDDYKITDNISLTQKDIRDFQLAKAAIRAAIELILEEANLKVEELKHIYLAGGLGSSVSPESAIKVGLIPHQASQIATQKGNTALLGAEQIIINPKLLDTVDNIAKRCINLNLNDIPAFTTELMKQMWLENKDSFC